MRTQLEWVRSEFPRNSPAAPVVSLCLAAPLGSRAERGERLLLGGVCPLCSCSGFIQRFLWMREVEKYGSYSRTGKLATSVAFFHLGRKLGELKLLKMNRAAHEIHNRWRLCPLALQLSALFLPDYDFKQQ